MARRPADTFQVADRVTVLRDGTVAGAWERSAFDEGAVLAAEMSRRMGDLGDIEGELVEEPRGVFGSLMASIERMFRGGG
jgi:ABC-type sugar transport system ATPase subunit